MRLEETLGSLELHIAEVNYFPSTPKRYRFDETGLDILA